MFIILSLCVCVCVCRPMEEIEAIREQFEALERIKCNKIHYTVAVILAWNLIFMNFVAPKTEPRYLTANEMYLIQLNIGFFLVFLVFIVFHIEKEVMQVINYLAFFLLYMCLIAPEYHIPKEIFIPTWLFAAGTYVMFGISMSSLPFFIYPSRWQAVRNSVLQKHQREQQRQHPILVTPPAVQVQLSVNDVSPLANK